MHWFCGKHNTLIQYEESQLQFDVLHTLKAIIHAAIYERRTLRDYPKPTSTKAPPLYTFTPNIKN